MTQRLSGKTVIVTAAAQGIGRACVERCVADGARVIATDLSDTVAALAGPSVDTLTLDGTDGGAVARTLGEIQADALIHAVGYVHHGALLACDEADWTRSFRINVDSAYHALRAVLPGMITRGGGAIVLIASVVSSVKGLPDRAAYGATKAALIGLAKSVARDYIGDNVRCNAVCPGTIESPSLQDRMRALGETVGGYDAARQRFIDRQPLGRLGRPEEVAALCALLAGDDGSFITGQALPIDGGISV